MGADYCAQNPHLPTFCMQMEPPPEAEGMNRSEIEDDSTKKRGKSGKDEKFLEGLGFDDVIICYVKLYVLNSWFVIGLV